MTLEDYPGLVPSNVSKDAKYSVRSREGEWHVSLVYRLNNREQELLTTADHPELVEMVNDVKVEANGVAGGTFYINEFGDVVVPAADGHYWGGHYERVLEFSFDGGVISPQAPRGLQPGDPWPGPHVGIRYVLTADRKDIRYELKPTRTRTIKVHLSDEVGPDAAARLARRLLDAKGEAGRIYINEAAEFFSPPGQLGDPLVYLGPLGEDFWFDPPDLPRP